MSNPGGDVVETDPPQVFGDFAGGAELPVGQLGMPVKIPPPLDHAGFDGREIGLQPFLCVLRVSRRQGRGEKDEQVSKHRIPSSWRPL